MANAAKRLRLLGGGALALSALALGASPALGAGPPIIGATYASAVSSEAAKLSAQINPNGSFTTYHFEYVSEAAYEQNGFTGALRSPASGEAGLGATPLTVSRQLFGLAAATTYRYRVVAKNSDPGSPTTGPTETLTTFAKAGGVLADSRGWEMVSPPEKNGGQVEGPGAIAGGGVLQAAAQGGAATYGSLASFAGGQGGPLGSQYIATRTSSGWSTENITAPIAYQSEDEGVPYQLFSEDLERGLMANGEHCEAGSCTVGNLPLAGTDALPGYEQYYLREGGSFAALLGVASAGFLTIGPAHFDLRLEGASADLGHVVLSSCAKLSANATQVPQGEGCDQAKQNLYEYTAGKAGLTLLNLLPAQSTGTPGAALAAQAGAVSEDGFRVYFTDEGKLYLRSGTQTVQADADAGGGGRFQVASADGTVAFFLKSGHLYRYTTASGHATDITPSGGVAGVLGASADGNVVYFQDASALKRWQEGTSATVAAGAEAAEAANWPPTTGTARVSADGTELLFGSTEALTGYDNTDLATGEADSELFLYDASTPSLTCVSCNPTNARPIGPSGVPGAIANGSAPFSTHSYKPRVLTDGAKRVFFDSADALVPTDVNTEHISGAGIKDAYEWEAQGEGSCARAGGCLSLISSGHDPVASSFIDASADGADAFFLTGASLITADPGAQDLYDARVGGGFTESPPPIPCEGDACQVLPPEPIDPTLTTLLSGRGNPAVSYARYGAKKKGKGQHKKHPHHHAGKSRRRRHRGGGR